MFKSSFGVNIKIFVFLKLICIKQSNFVTLLTGAMFMLKFP